jgi:MFS family permease
LKPGQTAVRSPSPLAPAAPSSDLRLGLAANRQQFTLLALITSFVGLVVGVERVAVPILGKQGFHLTSFTIALAFITSFGFVKAALNLLAGRLADHYGRKPLLIAGWLVALPVPFMIIIAPSWAWVVAANVLVGVNQGLAWSMTVTSKIDLVGPKRRGFAMGINEFSGYAGVSVGGIAAGYLVGAYGLRPAPYLLMLAVALAGLALSVLTVRETMPFAHLEARTLAASEPCPSWWEVFTLTSWRNKSMFALSQAGLIEKFADTLAWGLLPIFFLRHGLSPTTAGALVGVYTGAWAVLQLVTGHLSDRIGRKWPIVCGMWLAAAGVIVIGATEGVGTWTGGAIVMGIGMALLYPTLLAGISDVAHPTWRATSLGVYRMWRDSGYAFGGLTIGLVADHFGLLAGFWFSAGILVLSGILVAVLVRETQQQT